MFSAFSHLGKGVNNKEGQSMNLGHERDMLAELRNHHASGKGGYA